MKSRVPTIDRLPLAAISFSVFMVLLSGILLPKGAYAATARESEGWKAGVDGSVVLINVGVGGSLDTENIKDPIIGFVFGQKGLMGNLTLEGTKITRMNVEKQEAGKQPTRS